MQQKLKDQGHDAGPVDGIMGPKTQAALKEFQSAKGLKESGQLDRGSPLFFRFGILVAAVRA